MTYVNEWNCQYDHFLLIDFVFNSIFLRPGVSEPVLDAVFFRFRHFNSQTSSMWGIVHPHDRILHSEEDLSYLNKAALYTHSSQNHVLRITSNVIYNLQSAPVYIRTWMSSKLPQILLRSFSTYWYWPFTLRSSW